MNIPDLSDIKPGRKGLSFGIITYNEEDYLERCINAIRSSKYTKDCPIIVVDGHSIDGTVEIAKKLKVQIASAPFEGHFANQKNYLMYLCKTSWMFNVDADEILTTELLDSLNGLMDQDRDAYLISRVNIIDGEETDVYPDYQVRLYRSYCRYIYPVHEELVGYHSLGTCNIDIIHDKKSERHSTRNSMYKEIEKLYNHELKYMKED